MDVTAFENLALPAIEQVTKHRCVAIIDELGQMELFSHAFTGAFNRLLSQPIPVVATIHSRHHPVTDAIKQRPDVELLEVHQHNADELLVRLTAQLSI